MKKIYFLLVLLFSVVVFSQTTQEVEKISQSNSTKEISAFVKKYPNHPKNPELKARIMFLLKGETPVVNNIKAKPSVEKMNKEVLENKIEKDRKDDGKISNKNKQTVDLLNHIMNSDPSRKEAYVLIKNLSSCNLVIKFSGKKFYNLDVPKNGQNFILVPKGNYTLTSSVCDAKYSSVKNITGDIEVTLNAKSKAKN